MNHRAFSPKRCSVCAAKLTVHECASGDTCSRDTCRQTALKAHLQRDYERNEALRRRVRARLREPTRTLGIDKPDDLPLGILPSARGALVNVPKASIDRFRDRLTGVLTRASARRFGHTEADPSENDAAIVAKKSSESAFDAHACATCRGHCCSQGGEHAFVNVETVLRYWDAAPDARPQQILTAYMDKLPQRHIAGSCVYHGSAGCHLPREMRSCLCNFFRCKGLNTLLVEIEQRGADRALLAATADGEVTRAAFVVTTADGNSTRAGLMDATADGDKKRAERAETGLASPGRAE